jgi:phytoene dehydrogenase-like protein
MKPVSGTKSLIQLKSDGQPIRPIPADGRDRQKPPDRGYKIMIYRNGNHTTNKDMDKAIVIGGGLAGLAAATMLARAGLSVDLYERAHHLGGRAASQTREDFVLNQGPHALYVAGSGLRVLRSLGVEPQGRTPQPNGAILLQDRLHPLSLSLWSFLTTSLMSWPVRVELIAAFAKVARTDPAAWGDHSVRNMVERLAKRSETQRLLLMVNRVTTYANQPELQSARAAAAQWRRALTKVLYLDGGWQSLVDGLRRQAEQAGVRIATGTRAVAIERAGQGTIVCLDNGSQQAAAAVIIATPPTVVGNLLRNAAGAALDGWLPRSPMIRAATLDVALNRLPNPALTFSLGADAPLYYSVHSAAARLAPNEGAVLHVARYVAANETLDAEQVKEQLEGFLDRLQPGWRQVTAHKRFLPDLIVSHALDLAGDARLGKSTPAVPGLPSVFVAGDWVGQEGMLADAALASAEAAAQLALRHVRAGAVQPAQPQPVYAVREVSKDSTQGPEDAPQILTQIGADDLR